MEINEARLSDSNVVNHLLSSGEHFYLNEPIHIDLSFNRFVDRFLKGIREEKDYSIEYNGEDAFELTFAGQKNILTMSPERTKNYKQGIYDEVTKKLHYLVELYKTKIADRESIERLEIDPSEATEHEKQVYSLYLKKNARHALKGLAVSGAVLSAFSVSTYLFIREVCNLGPSSEISATGGLSMIAGPIIGFLGLVHLTCKNGLDSVKLKNFLRKLREIKKAKTIETSPVESIRIEDPVLIEFNKLLYSIQDLNPSDKSRFLERITILLDEYKEDKLFLIEKGRNPELLAISDNEEVTLRAKYMQKVVDLELEIGELSKRGQETKVLEQQSSIVEQNIEQMAAGKRLA